MALQRVRSNMLANNFVLDDDQGLIVGSGNNIYIDTVNNRVGINTNSPTHDFTVAGNIHATGNITAGGDITIGDSDTDTLTITAEIGSDILPDIDNTYDLGSAAKKWAEVHATTFYGDGSQLTGLSSTLDEVTTNGDTTTNSITVGGLIVNSTGALGLPIGTTAQRPTAADGLIRFNSDLVAFEGYDGVEWGALGGGGATYSATAPTTNLKEGDLWFDTGTTGELYVYSGTEWLSVTGAGGSAFYQRGFLGDGSTTAFNVYGTGTSTVVVYINGVFVTTPADYSYANGVVTFVTPPALNDEINVLVYGETTGISLSLDSLTDVDLTTTAPTDGQVLVYDISGNKFVPGDAAADFTDLTGSLALNQIPDGLITPAKLQSSITISDEFTASGSTADFTLSRDPGSAAAIQVFVDSVPQLVSNYTVNGTTLTLAAAPANGSIVEVRGYGVASSVGTPTDLSVTTNKIANGAVTAAKLDSAITTDDITEGSTNLYYTDARVDARVNAQTGANLDLSNKSTTDLAEGTNLYYTDARVDARLAGGSVGNIVTTGYLAGPATFTIDPAAVGDNTGTVVIAGDLQVDGTTTTINSTTLEVDDKNVILSAGSPNAAGSDGAGITVDNGSDTDATILYSGTNDAWHINKNLGLNFSNPQTNIHVIGTSTDPNVGIILQSHDTPSATSTLSLYARDASNVNQAVNIQNTLGNLYIDSNVGIGTTTPDALLHVSDTSPHIDIGPQGGNRGKIGYHDLDVIIGSTSGTGEIIFKNNIGSTDSPQTSGDTKMVIHDVGMTIYSDTYNILNVATDTNDDQTSTDGIIKITNGSSYTTKAEFRWDESEDLVHVSYGDHGRHISIDSSGNVGVGTGSTSPSTTLEVAGTAKADQYLLDAIDATINDTAVDVFVYDTRKDSDGGAWRKRTQHTSWYNETLNTATRGSRKEFPAVAVIVADSNRNVTIYDGDDPSLPMWMVFNSGSGTWILCTTGSLNLSMLNGVMSVGCDGTNQRFRTIDFIKERHREYSHTDGQYSLPAGIVTRNSAISGSYESGTVGLIDRTINDVAMTVLPNAPIDSATGLPVPTIAVATSGGTSVITDSGNIYDIGGFAPIDAININQDALQFSVQISSSSYTIIGPPTLSSDIAASNWDGVEAQFDANGSTPAARRLPLNLGEVSVLNKNREISLGGSGSGLFKIQTTPTNTDFNLKAQITSDYNTGWMNGDIKLATLSDTDDTDVTGSELVTNGTFDTDTSGWTVSGFSQSSGVITSSTSSSQADQTITTTSGETYVVSFDITANHADSQNGVYIRNADGSSHVDFRVNNQTGPFSGTFQATGSSMIIRLYNGGSAGTVSYDNISVRIAEEDRSVNGNGLQVFGTVTKNPVATGADLVAYSGFSASNYLFQPYDAALSPGNANVCFMHWHKGDTNKTMIWTSLRRPVTQSDAGWIQFWTGTTSGYQIQFGVNSGTGSDNRVGVNSTAFHDGQWHHYVGLRRDGVYEIYVDGKLQGSTNHGSNNTLTTDTHKFLIGNHFDFNSAYSVTGDMALVKYSLTAPSAEQIKKIYEDEKVLFQENAQATLYGSSDAVTALAYDDDTELLHVGTSAGRSVFQGLRRVENTTDAVGSAISASNGLVAED